MINNSYLSESYTNRDNNIGLCYLLDLASRGNHNFLDSLKHPLDIEHLSEEEKDFITISIAALSYHLEEIPDWFHDDRLVMGKPYFYDKRIDGIYKVKLIASVNSFCLSKNVYISKHGVQRV